MITPFVLPERISMRVIEAAAARDAKAAHKMISRRKPSPGLSFLPGNGKRSGFLGSTGERK
ncbi:MAG: hypothetical protein ABIG63_08920 [Chloroflexota bacterium]